MEKFKAELIIILISFPITLALAWIPMLAWNEGVSPTFHVETIGYFQAFWLAMGLSYLTTKVVAVKDK